MAAAANCSRRGSEGHPYETKLLEQKTTGLLVKGTHRRSGLARDHKLPKELFESQAYKELVDAYAKVVDVMGNPPFTINLGERTPRPRASPSSAARFSTWPATA